jgi:hypothetical protein
MPLAVGTRTLIRRRWRVPFLWGSLRAAWQARRSPGYLGGSLRVMRGSEFWTLTFWRDGVTMHAFRESGTHGALMPKMSRWASQASTTAWKVEIEPSWDEAFGRMADNPSWLAVQRPEPHLIEVPPVGGLAFPVPRRRRPVKELDE